MIYHVLPGDSLVEEFQKTAIAGEIIVCREAFIVGPVSADSPDIFWNDRARFILTEYAEDEIEFHERVADELEKLSDMTPDDEVNLWFEYELFCSVNMWFCISRLAYTGAAVFRVEPITLSENERWSGFGQLDGDELKRCFDSRQLLTADDLKLGTELWNAFRHNNLDLLPKLAATQSTRFPYLLEVVGAAVEIDSKPPDILTAIQNDGITDFTEIFVEFTKRGGVYGYGDLQVQGWLNRI